MYQTGFSRWIPQLITLARQAGRAILEIRESGVDVASKEDLSPVTQADEMSEDLILAGLRGLTPQVPIISEESGIPPWATRRHWKNFWLVDPLDGTREFIAGRDEFTINVAFVIAGVPLLGLIAQPITDQIIVAYQGEDRQWACFSQTGERQAIDLTKRRDMEKRTDRLKVVVSHHYGDRDIQFLPEKLKKSYANIDVVKAGSSLKFCLLAAQKADFYVRNAPTSEWDTAAGQAILRAVGGDVCDFSGRALVYNRRGSMLNPGFYAYGPGLATLDWL